MTLTLRNAASVAGLFIGLMLVSAGNIAQAAGAVPCAPEDYPPVTAAGDPPMCDMFIITGERRTPVADQLRLAGRQQIARNTANSLSQMVLSPIQFVVATIN